MRSGNTGIAGDGLTTLKGPPTPLDPGERLVSPPATPRDPSVAPWTYPLLLAGVLAVGAVLLPAASAHTGNAGGIQDGVLEVEDYDAPDGACDPDYDAEHTYPKDVEEASSGQEGFAPHSGCGFNFETLEVGDETVFEAIRVRTANCGPAHGTPYTQEVRVVAAEAGLAAGGQVVASGTFEMTCQDTSYQTLSFQETESLDDGAYDVRLEYEVTSADPSWINFHGDKLVVDAGQPQPEAAVTADAQPETDEAPEDDVATPAVTVPASCQAADGLDEACHEPTTVATPALEETCAAGLLCAGPVEEAQVDEVDPLCETASLACTDETQVLAEQTVVEAGTVPGVSGPEAQAEVVVADTDLRASQGSDEEAASLDERNATVPTPAGGVPVTACPGGCTVDQPAEAGAETGLAASASLGGEEVASSETGLSLP